ncbi:MAG: phospho-N-acetylmuramoyl-pentapeptide-transferase [Planctomycetota bacterium]|nr:phospho-N-acetylmuramoyl-pentapeptide-transferase [Planctomycetota bacterium]
MLYNLIELAREWLEDTGLYRFLMVFEFVTFRAVAAGILSMLIVVGFGKPVIRWLRAKKIGDAARFDVAALEAALSAKANTPTMGGVLIAAAIAVSTLLLADLGNRYVQMGLVVLLWMAVVGGFDDWLKLTASSRAGGSRQGLYAWEKLVFQLGLGILVGYFAYSHGVTDPRLGHVLNLPFQKTFEPGGGGVAEGLIYLDRTTYIIIMTLMIAGMSNAVNITDGMDGLASGITAAVAAGLAILAIVAGAQITAQYLLVPYVLGGEELAVMAGAMAGATLGFLWWNCAPAAVFMGDTGSLCLGGLLGYIAVIIRQEIVLLLMAGVFLLEIGSVVLQVGFFKFTARFEGQGRRIFRCAPFHWHLHMSGWTEQKIVVRLWIIAVVLCAVALASLKLR